MIAAGEPVRHELGPTRVRVCAHCIYITLGVGGHLQGPIAAVSRAVGKHDTEFYFNPGIVSMRSKPNVPSESRTLAGVVAIKKCYGTRFPL